jgi:hypothetical protein
MPRICYVEKTFQPKTMQIIVRADAICREYAAQGYDLTLRQLYYQFVARGWLDNNQKNYSRLGDIVSDARMAGLLDWDFIVDRTRNLRGLMHYNDPVDFIQKSVRSYHLDKWNDQDIHLEVWIEKDALVGVLEAACPAEDVDYFSCRGYTSASEIWGAAQRIRTFIEAGKQVVILHLGDHDPSGVDMSRDIRDRLCVFLAQDLGRIHSMPATEYDYLVEESISEMAGDLTIDRIALNMDQVRQFNPPPNPAKVADARYANYVTRYGRECWELDALPPDVLVNLIRGTIQGYRDPDRWKARVKAEKVDLEYLKQAAKRWASVKDLIKDQIRKEREQQAS